MNDRLSLLFEHPALRGRNCRCRHCIADGLPANFPGQAATLGVVRIVLPEAHR